MLNQVSYKERPKIKSLLANNCRASLNSSAVVGVSCNQVRWKWCTIATNYTLYLKVNYSKSRIFEIGNYDFDSRFIQRKAKKQTLLTDQHIFRIVGPV